MILFYKRSIIFFLEHYRNKKKEIVIKMKKNIVIYAFEQLLVNYLDIGK